MTKPNIHCRIAKASHRISMISFFLKPKLGSTPVTTLSIILHCVICAKTDPLGKRAVLPLLLGKCALGAEGLL